MKLAQTASTEQLGEILEGLAATIKDLTDLRAEISALVHQRPRLDTTKPQRLVYKGGLSAGLLYLNAIRIVRICTKHDLKTARLFVLEKKDAPVLDIPPQVLYERFSDEDCVQFNELLLHGHFEWRRLLPPDGE